MSPIRITLSRAAGWRKPEGAIIVSRPSIWGNPWRAGDPATFWLPRWPVRHDPVGLALTQHQVVDLYRTGLSNPGGLGAMLPGNLIGKGQIAAAAQLRDHFAAIRASLPLLAGHDLCCWCKPWEPCHCDPLLEVANA